MRGPGFRRDLDVRRLWRCPGCGVERRLSGEHTSLRCHCRPEGVWMQIVGERNAVPRAVSVMSAPEISVADFQLTEEELAKPLEGRVRRRPFGRTGPDGPTPPDRRSENRPHERSSELAADASETSEPAASPEEFVAREEHPGGKPRRERKRRNPKPISEHSPDVEATAEFPESTPPSAPKPELDPSIDADDGFAAGLE